MTGNAYWSGEILVNSVSRARYAGPLPPDSMRIRINTAGVGTFDYLTPLDARNALRLTAGCL